MADFNIGNIPSAKELISELVLNKVKLLTYPNKQTVEIPLVKKEKKQKKTNKN